MKIDERSQSGFWSTRGEPLGTDTPHDTEKWKADKPEPVKKVVHPIRRTIPPTRVPLIRNLQGKVIGRVGKATKPEPDMNSKTPYHNSLMETRAERRHQERKHSGKVERSQLPKGTTMVKGQPEDTKSYHHRERQVAKKTETDESVTPFYDALVQEDMTTGDIASVELPLRRGGMIPDQEEELRRRKKKYYRLAQIGAWMAGSGGAF